MHGVLGTVGGVGSPPSVDGVLGDDDDLKGEDPAEELASETGTAEPTLEMSVSEVMRAFWPGCSLPRSTRSSMCDRGGPGGAGGGGRGG